MTSKKSVVTIEEKLRALFDLQLIDSRIDEIRFTRGELPLEVKDFEDEIAGIETRVCGLTEKISEFEEQVKIKKEQINRAGEQIKKYTKQQDNVRNNREFDALTKEVEYQELEKQLAEKKIKEYMAKTAHCQQEIVDCEQELALLKDHLKHKKEELDRLVHETEKEEAFLKEKSEKYAKKVEERLINAYRRIRSKVKNGLAIVPVERGASSGSYFTIPPQRQLEIAQRKKIIVDEHSGRILVDEELAQEEREKLKTFLDNNSFL